MAPMGKAQQLLIRTAVVVGVAAVVRILDSGFDLDAFVEQLVWLGLPMLAGLAAFGAFGPGSGTRIHAALYPTLYGWVVYFVGSMVFQDDGFLSSLGADRFWSDGIRIPIGFVLAVPTLYVLDAVWKPKAKEQ